MELQNSINITYGILDNIFQILDAENVTVKQIMPCLAILSKKSEIDIVNIVKKTHNYIRKTKSYLKKYPNDLQKLYPDFPEKGKEERPAGHVGVFCQNLGITHSIYFRNLFQF